MLIIPAIDILNDSVVRLEQGEFRSVTDYKISPVQQAVVYEELGFEWIHIVDLSGSKDGKINTFKILTEIKKKTNLRIEFGGGIRNIDDVTRLLDVPVDKLIVGSVSVSDKKEFENIILKAGGGRIIAAADVWDEHIQIKGWTQNSGINLYDHIAYCSNIGVKDFLVTDIKNDGLLTGPSFELYRKLRIKFPAIKMIASGGIRNMDDLNNLAQLGMQSAVIGKAIYEKKINLKELAAFGS